MCHVLSSSKHREIKVPWPNCCQFEGKWGSHILSKLTAGLIHQRALTPSSKCSQTILPLSRFFLTLLNSGILIKSPAGSMLLSLIHSLLLLPITRIIPLLDKLQSLLDKLNSVNRVFMRYDKVNSSKSHSPSAYVICEIKRYV